VWDGERLVAVAPLMLTERPAVGPVRVRMLHFFGADPNITELRGWICRPGDEAAAARALFSELTASRGEWDWAVWSGLPAASPALDELGAVEWVRDTPDFWLDTRAESWDAFRAGLKHNIKESLRKCYNSLKRDGLAATLRVVSARSEVAGALEHFFRLHSARAGATDTLSHRDVFDSPAARRFLVEASERFAERDATRIFLLEISGKVVATRLGYLLGDELYLYFSGFDPEWGKYSVMTTAVAEALKWAIAQRVPRVNLSTGSDVSKTRWGPNEVLFRDARLRSGSVRGALAFEAFHAALRAQKNERFQRVVGRLLARRR
jgi:CelD/BcsL family acetyltransferase involved in cellulose biosynthesis